MQNFSNGVSCFGGEGGGIYVGRFAVAQRGLAYLVNSYEFFYKLQFVVFWEFLLLLFFNYKKYVFHKLQTYVFNYTFHNFCFNNFPEYFTNALPTFEPTQTNLLQARQVFFWTVTAPNKDLRDKSNIQKLSPEEHRPRQLI